MKLFYYCEFLENGSTIALISIGIVAGDGREYYAICDDAPLDRIGENEWLVANVVPSLPIAVTSAGHLVWDATVPDYEAVKPRAQIAAEIRSFVLDDHPHQGPYVELWADFGAYDHVALCQLYGSMMDLPEGMPMFTHDLQQEASRLGLADKDLPRQAEGHHNALADARHNRVVAAFLASRPAAGEATG